MNDIVIGKHCIGPQQPVFIIAEAGVNHNGDVSLALELVRKAKEIGADCVKFQTFKADRVVTSYAPKAAYQLEVTDQAESQLDMLKKLELGDGDYRKIIELGKELEIEILSTPYSEEDARFLNDLGLNAFKVASGQLIELSFLEALAKMGKPIILSTGMGNAQEVEAAVQTIRNAGNEQLVVLQCTTNYPSRIEDSNIRAMNTIATDNQVLVGYSDHVPNNYACYAAVALGARVIEKHFTLDTEMEGPDHSSSLNPEDFAELINGIRAVELSLGTGEKVPSAIEVENAKGMRRSVVARKALSKGTVLSLADLTYKRPASGWRPDRVTELLGRKLKDDVEPDQQITPNQLD